LPVWQGVRENIFGPLLLLAKYVLNTRHKGSTPCLSGKEFARIYFGLYCCSQNTFSTPATWDQLLAGLAKSSEPFINTFISLDTRHPGIISLPGWQRVQRPPYAYFPYIKTPTTSSHLLARVAKSSKTSVNTAIH
jgi:hypothetical protein